MPPCASGAVARKAVLEMRILIRWALSAVSIYLAALIVPGIRLEDDRAILALAVTAVILGGLNAIVRPLLALLACGFIVLTLGFGLLLINGLMLYWASLISRNWLNIQFVVDGYWSAFFGSIVISVTSFFLNAFVPEKTDKNVVIWRGDA